MADEKVNRSELSWAARMVTNYYDDEKNCPFCNTDSGEHGSECPWAVLYAVRNRKVKVVNA